MTSNLLTS